MKITTEIFVDAEISDRIETAIAESCTTNDDNIESAIGILRKHSIWVHRRQKQAFPE